MNKEKYNEQRASLMAEAEGLIAENKFEESEAKMNEVKDLDNKWEDAKKAQANLAALKGNNEPVKLENKSEAVQGGEILGTTEQPKVTNEQDIYVNAWAKDMMGQKLTENEMEVFENVNAKFSNEFTHDTNNTQVLIPETVAAGIWKRAEEQYPLWADVRKLRVKGHLSMIKGNNSAEARWYDEADIVDTDELGFGTLELTGNELAKAVQVTWKLRKMAINEFVAYIQREIADRMGIALAHGVYEGKGKPGSGETFKPEPFGIKTRLAAESGTPQVLEYTELAYTNLTAAMGGLHSSYVNGAAIYANNATIWSTLANLVDGNGRPMFIADVMSGGVGRIFGRVVKADASIPEGEILVGNPNAGYIANINEDITMYKEEHVRERLTDYMGYAIVDGDVVDSQAFVILRAGDATPEV
ncbi:phage major capsid protein [Oceanobacillus profundus]|uniref:phage major capsid protein n=1 Tax=Oceanobacillus profundus TaxID=372463 RepID=UPI0026E3018E|nr:phage major capsid protein [Oceanobacillus profundus]MDO6451724.1 phage major capsid protein [Oceanobacillus profundus]